jgi:hypothetical protein
MSFDPSNVDFVIVRGSLYINEWNFWNDLKHTEEFSLEPYTEINLFMENVGTLSLGKGLTKTKNKLRVVILPTQTSMRPSAHYYLELWEGSTGPYYIAKGIMTFEAP